MRYAILKDRKMIPVEMLEWAKWFETPERFIANDKQGDVRVSTIFLGMDHAFGQGTPLWFETMIFGGPENECQWRYATLEEAEAGHKEACKLAGISPAGSLPK